LEASLITPAQLKIALDSQKRNNRRLGEILISRGWIEEKTIEYLIERVVLPERRKLNQKYPPLRQRKNISCGNYNSQVELAEAALEPYLTISYQFPNMELQIRKSSYREISV
jgi:hypothetical protein